MIQSPLNYTGGKYKLLPQILPLFPKDIDVFVDLFCEHLGIIYNVNIGHASPIGLLPLGIEYQIDLDNKTIAFKESGVKV